MAITRFLNKLSLNYRNANGQSSEPYEFESFIDFDHVYYDNKVHTIETEIETETGTETKTETRPWNLKDFFKKVSTFFNKPMFMIYSKSDTSPALNIMEWYEVSGDKYDSRITEQ